MKRLSLLLMILLTIPSCKTSVREMLEPGVNRSLAEYRKKYLKDISYDLYFNIPPSKEEPITGNAKIRFHQARAQHGLILDFRPGKESIKSLKVNGKDADYQYINQHIVLSSRGIIPAENLLEIEFVAGNEALNRSEDFLYTLFVPDRAATAFPCFDQPDLKALFSLTLEIPSGWKALTNGPLNTSETRGDRKTLTFSPDQPISTYLFAFTAGKFDTLSHTRNGRKITMFHREPDEEKLQRNATTIFQQHFEALEWLEDYTGIPYPFEKFDMALLPGFQYSGMEHPGAIWYRDNRLLLDENAPIDQQLGKASLIAHETAHMWFGNLVTMEWFDDVWLKEVFAGFMADKIVHPQFPEINHALRFILSHYPRAYAIDRSKGTHPIKQELSNMNLAGTLYGAIIYNKAPIVFEQLEWLMGEEAFRKAVQEYLATFAMDNADWDDLAAIFNRHSMEVDIAAWSNAWIYGKGMPQIAFELPGSTDGPIRIHTPAEENQESFPAQQLNPVILIEGETFDHEVFFDRPQKSFHLKNEAGNPEIALLNGGGGGYGYFVPNNPTRKFLIENIHSLEKEVLRATAHLNLYEDFLRGNIEAVSYFQTLKNSIREESNAQLQSYLLSNLETVFLRFFSKDQRQTHGPVLEALLLEKLQETQPGEKALFLSAFTNMALSNSGKEALKALFEGRHHIEGLSLSEEQRLEIAAGLMIRQHPAGREMLELLMEETGNPDRRRRMDYILPALSSDRKVRDDFFQKLKNPENRRPEPWTVEALTYLNHPLREDQHTRYLKKSLDLLPEIQETGDIFFPLNWLAATVGLHSSGEAKIIVQDFLKDHPELNENLRLKVLQASDLLFRTVSEKEL